LRPTAASLRVRAATVAALGVAVATAGDAEGWVLCPYRRSTAGYCPLCGATRAAARLMSGDVEASWRMHPLVILVAVQVPIVWAVGRRMIGSARSDLRQRWLLANLGLAMLLWVVRSVSGDVPLPTGLGWPVPRF
jgi:hypothetical protein